MPIPEYFGIVQKRQPSVDEAMGRDYSRWGITDVSTNMWFPYDHDEGEAIKILLDNDKWNYYRKQFVGYKLEETILIEDGPSNFTNVNLAMWDRHA